MPPPARRTGLRPWCCIFLAVLGIAPTAALAQTATESARPLSIVRLTPAGTVLQRAPVEVAGTAVVDLAELARRDALLPPPLEPLAPRRMRHKLIEPSEPNDPAAMLASPITLPAPPASLNVASPAPSRSFVGLDDIPIGGTGFVVVPPDVDGAVGRTKILEGLNNNYRVLSKANGGTLSTVSTNTFWAASGGTINSYFDPKMVYDPIHDRWIVCMLSDGGMASSSIEIGISVTDDPEGAYFIFRVDADPTDLLTADFPTLGFNKNWVAINVNMFNITGGTYNSSKCLVIDYPQLRGGTLMASFFPGTGFCSSPSATYSSTENTLYVPTHISSGGGTYRVDTITGTPGAPTYTVGTTLSRGLTWTQAGGNILPQAPPLGGASACVGGPCKIEAQDAQIRSTPVVKGGFLYYAQSVGASGLSRTMAQWTKLALPAGSVADGGRIEDPTATATNGGKWYSYPHVAVNGAGDVMVGYSQFASNQFPAAAYSMRLAADAPGTMRDPVIYKAGEDYYHKTFSTATGRNRWGDYSKLQVDPCDDATLWSIQEYAKLRVGTDDGNTGTNSSRWSTWIAAVAGPPSVVTIAPGASQPEGDAGNVAFTFTISIPVCSGIPVTVQYHTEDGTATVANGDYVAASGSVTILPGSTAVTVTVNAAGDTRYEADETFVVKLDSATGGVIGSPGTATATIVNDDLTPPALSIDDVTVVEGDAGTVSCVFTVSVTPPSGLPLSVDYQTQDLTATLANGDYVPAAGTLTIPAKTSSGQIVMTVNGDLTFEADERFLLGLMNPVGATIADGQGVGTISNDDLVPALSIDDVPVVEGNGGPVTATFTVTLSNPTDRPVTVDYETHDATATVANGDYLHVQGTVTLPAKTLSATLVVTVNGDITFEGDERFSVDLTLPVDATIADAQGIGTITNDDVIPTVSIDDVKVLEGNDGGTPATFTVTLSHATGQTVTVDYQTIDGTATLANDDYVATTGTLVIPPKSLGATFDVIVNGDLKFEADETFQVRITNPVNAGLGDDLGTGTISTDDLTPPAVSIDDVEVVEGDGGSVAALFTISLAAASGMPVTVDYQTQDLTATLANGDYVSTQGTATIPPKMLSTQVVVMANGDLTSEADERFLVELSNPSGAVVGDGQGLGVIVNDDTAPTVSVDDVKVVEGDAGAVTATFTVTLSHPTDQTVTVDHQTLDGTATIANGDYVTTTGTLVIPPKSLGATFDVQVNGDLKFEIDETFQVQLANPVNAGLGMALGIGTISNDDSRPSIIVDDVSQEEGNSGLTAFEFTVSLSYESGEPITCDYVVSGVSAIEGEDFVATTGTLTIPPKTLAGQIIVPVNGDLGSEADETFVLTLSNPSNASLGDDQGAGTIENDDFALAAPGPSSTKFALVGIVPNPTTGSTRIDYLVGREADIRIRVVDLQGRTVATVVSGRSAPGRHQAVWNGTGARGPAPAGLYFVQYDSPGRKLVRRILVTR